MDDENKRKRKHSRKFKNGSGQAYLDKNKNKWVLQYRYTDWTGAVKKSTKRNFNTKADAYEWLNKFLEKKQADLDMLFRNLTEIYIEDMAGRIKQQTLITKKYIIDDKLLPYFGDMPMSDITPATIRKWQSVLLAKNFAPTYLRTIYNQLNAIFNYAVLYYDLESNPCKKAGSIGEKNADEMLFWTIDEFMQFADAIVDKRPAYIGFKVLFWTGIRIGELLALALGDIDFDKKTLRINKTYYRHKSMDNINTPKTERGKRIISLPDFILRDLQDYADSMYGLQLNDRLFPFTKSYFTAEMKRGVKLSGVKKIRIHDIRHSHIAHLIELNFPPLEIAERTGHDVKTLLSVYAHLYPNKQSKMAERLDEEFRKEHDDAGDEQKPKT